MPGQDAHDFAGSAGGQGLSPVVDFGVAQYMQGLDDLLQGGFTAEQQVPDLFMVNGMASGNGGGRGALSLGLKHGSGFPVVG